MNIAPGANSLRTGPNERGRFGEFGGRFVAETLMPLILEVGRAYEEAKADPGFDADLKHHLKHYVGRPSPLWFAERLTEHLGGAKVYFKRDELNHTGSHKANNCMGQILLARRMGKTRIIAETGAGQHGVATATMCALVRPSLHRLHGRHRCGTAIAQRVPHEAARGRGQARDLRRRHAEGRDERGDARLGGQRHRHLLPDRHRRRPAPLSHDGARLPVGDRRGSQGSSCRKPKAGCPTPPSPVSAAGRMRWACFIHSWTIQRFA